MHIFLDESGDLGFDLDGSKKQSRFFAITLLVIKNSRNIKQISKSVRRTLENKLNTKKYNSRIVQELKGSLTTLEIKKYFLKHMNNFDDWSLYTIILNKKALHSQVKNHINRDRVYNQMTHQLLEHISFSEDKEVNLIVDRSKSNLGIKEFNEFLRTNLNLALNLETRLYITHDKSEKHPGIQAVDMFCYGITRKYEQNDMRWYDCYKKNIAVECEFKVKDGTCYV